MFRTASLRPHVFRYLFSIWAFVLVPMHSVLQAREAAPIEQKDVERAMAKLKARQAAREKSPTKTTPKTPQAATQPSDVKSATNDSDPYSTEAVTKVRLQLIEACEAELKMTRLALRAKRASPEDVRALTRKKAVIEGVALAKLRELLKERDEKNAERLKKFQKDFGELRPAAQAVANHLIRIGVVESVSFGAANGDPSADLMAGSAGDVLCTFRYVTKSGVVRVVDGSISFGTGGDGLWIPTEANIDGVTPTYLLDAFTELRPWIITVGNGALNVERR